jgi:hypothetical protein
MAHDTRGAVWIRGLVKCVFIGCFIAFMWASIHHLAAYYNSFEAENDNWFGSYLLAGAVDITALVATIGVMFFRKSMPRGIQVIVWIFIGAIACYSFFLNWEYAAHFQAASLTLQPTGETTPVFDAQGSIHYVPVMRQNTALLFINPLLASGFTIFSLIYSIVAEFFGTKAPTIEELREKETYLKETEDVQASIKKLEASRKGRSLLATLKEKALEGKAAWKEVTKQEEDSEKIEGEEETKNKETNSEDEGDSEEKKTNTAPKTLTMTGQSRKQKSRFSSKRKSLETALSIHVDLVAEQLGVKPAEVRKLKLATARRNTNMILKEALADYLKKKQAA